jgi:hypothetical protein
VWVTFPWVEGPGGALFAGDVVEDDLRRHYGTRIELLIVYESWLLVGKLLGDCVIMSS